MMKMSRTTKIILIGLFVVTRLFIWVYRPVEFTDVVHNFMAYAHLWASGERPYLDQWYEYPPGTIPLFKLPHVVDMTTLNTPWHVDYATGYRLIMLVTDGLLFWFMWKVLIKSKVKSKIFVTAIIYYCLITAKAHHFMYDKIDLLFAAATVFGVAVPILIGNSLKDKVLTWLGFFVAVSLKLINIPLGLIYLITQKKSLKQSVLGLVIAFILTLAVPVMYFRSSLLVMYVYHKERGLQVESVPAVIVSTINKFTKSEQFVEVYKNYDIVGPVSAKVKAGFDVLFPVSLFVWLGYAVNKAWGVKSNGDRVLMDQYLSVLYIFIFMLTTKVLSTPFLLWHIPFLTIYPFRSSKLQLKLMSASLVIIAVSMTKIPDLNLGLVNLHLVIGWVRSGLILWILIEWFRQRKQLANIN